jgi:uncharacterized phage protein gp47/JayE
MSFNLRTYSAIYDSIKSYIIANQDIITDFNDGGVLSSEIEAFSRQLAQAYAEDRAGFTEVLKKLPYSIFDFSAKSAVTATGIVTFTRTDTTVSVTISSGTQISTTGGVVFETTTDVSMPIGTANVSVAVEAVTSGTTGNVSAGTVTTIVSSVDADSVTNSSAMAGGVDAETTAQALSRFRSYLMGLSKSNKYGIMYAALLNTSVRSASVLEHFPPKSNLYNFTLYIDDGNGSASSEMIAAVKKIVDGDGTQTNPGYRAAGINCDILAPTILYQAVTATITVNYDVDVDEAKSTLGSAITSYINSLVLGETLIRSQLMKAILNYTYVTDIVISSPSDNIAADDSEIIRAGTIVLTIDQEE